MRHDAAEEEREGKENFDHVTIRRKQISASKRAVFIREANSYASKSKIGEEEIIMFGQKTFPNEFAFGVRLCKAI